MRKVITTNHVRFDQSYFPYRKQSVLDEHIKDLLENQLQVESVVTWEARDKTVPRSAYEKVHYDPVTDDLVMRVVDKPEIFVRVNQYLYLTDILQEHWQRALVAQVAATLDKAEGT